MLIAYIVHLYHIAYPSPKVYLSVWRCLLMMNSKYTISTLYIGEGNGTPPHYPCLENPTDRGTLWATVHMVTESDMTEVT